MDGTGKNVKMKRKDRNPEKGKGSKCWRNKRRPLISVTGSRRVSQLRRDACRYERDRSYFPEKLFAMPAAIGTSNFSC